MITFYYFLRLAARNLGRGGQRVLIALLCITFGVTALVALTSIARSIEDVLLVEPAQLIGGDISAARKVEEHIPPEQVAQLDALQQTGEIARYTLIALNSSIMFHTSGSGEMHFVANGMGVEPDKYPLSGSLVIGDPRFVALPDLLAQVGDVVITRDIAQRYDLKVGDRIVLADARVGSPIQAVIRGIAYDTPNHQGDKIYYTLAAAQLLENGGPAANTAIINTDRARAVAATLEDRGWTADWVAGRRSRGTGNMWVIGLRGAGILGLLVGGIGIANTMQVLLRRRQREIAVLKTLGYGAGHLRVIFSLEAGLLGLAGSVLGAALGMLIGGEVLELFRRTSSVLYEWRFSPVPPLMGILAGTLASLIFACWAIFIAGQARPMALLRNDPIDLRRLPGCQPVALAMLLAAPFAILAGMVMESAPAAAGVLLGAMTGIAALAGLFAGLLAVAARALPLRRFPLARMALRSLRRRGLAIVFAMVALFVGVLSMSLGLAVAQIGERQFSLPSGDFGGYNLNVLAAADEERTIRDAVATQRPEKVGVGYRTALAGVRLAGGESAEAVDPILVGRSDPEDYTLRGAAWGSRPDGAYLPSEAHAEAGSQVVAVLRDGSTRVFTVVGSYEINTRSISLIPPSGLVVSGDTFVQAASPDSLTFFVRIAPDRLSSAAAALGAALPEATVINLVAYAARFMEGYRNLFVLPMTVAGLALLAGCLLVANSVSLAMLERRYEIGVLKTVGYARHDVLAIFGVEYGLAGVIATSAAVGLVQALLAVLSLANHLPASVLLLNARSLALIAACGVGLTLLTVLGVTWGPARVPPVVVLNARD